VTPWRARRPEKSLVHRGARGIVLAPGLGVASQVVLHQLLLLNIALQLFDGVASYHGVPWWGEANPLIYEAMVALGIGPALLLYKAKACGFLLLVRRLSDPGATLAVYSLVAVAYGTLSFLPWLVRFGSLLVV
jgi:hypothetical protein